MKFNFPESVFVAKNFPAVQVVHILSEAEEVQREKKILDGITPYKQDPSAIDMEIMDLLHSCETYMRIRQTQAGTEYVDDLIEKVRLKNAERGYYVEGA